MKNTLNIKGIRIVLVVILFGIVLAVNVQSAPPAPNIKGGYVGPIDYVNPRPSCPSPVSYSGICAQVMTKACYNEGSWSLICTYGSPCSVPSNVYTCTPASESGTSTGDYCFFDCCSGSTEISGKCYVTDPKIVGDVCDYLGYEWRIDAPSYEPGGASNYCCGDQASDRGFISSDGKWLCKQEGNTWQWENAAQSTPFNIITFITSLFS